jgi:hypothetical protein
MILQLKLRKRLSQGMALLRTMSPEEGEAVAHSEEAEGTHLVEAEIEVEEETLMLLEGSSQERAFNREVLLINRRRNNLDCNLLLRDLNNGSKKRKLRSKRSHSK